MRALFPVDRSKHLTVLKAPRPTAILLAAATVAMATFGLALLRPGATPPAVALPPATVESPRHGGGTRTWLG